MRRTCRGEIGTISGMYDVPCGAPSGKETAPAAGMSDFSIKQTAAAKNSCGRKLSVPVRDPALRQVIGRQLQ